MVFFAGRLRLKRLHPLRRNSVPSIQPENGYVTALVISTTPALPPCQGGMAAQGSPWSLSIVRHWTSTACVLGSGHVRPCRQTGRRFTPHTWRTEIVPGTGRSFIDARGAFSIRVDRAGRSGDRLSRTGRRAVAEVVVLDQLKRGTWYASRPGMSNGLMRGMHCRRRAYAMPRGEAMEKGKREETNHCGASINHVAPCIILCRASNLAEELRLSSPFSSQLHAKRRASTMLPRSHVPNFDLLQTGRN